ncbi:AMP-binding protein [Streptacidiphilus sp. PB12-B1b]|uniref:AMP-binding protein n=1 Tax=Streptacidiphilus sp. PB12-B1b TaxID=2705012 RepID=UPI0015FC6E9A|nr:AMP-binding protein [Streptacidiphilus sp. PB12-B1b]QMU78106.1 AMP-binding protein [Streptacidiphilus sp. PB12-B1b]
MDDLGDSVAPYVVKALERFAGFGEREAIVSAGRRLTYADVRREVPALAAALTAHGVQPGSSVAVLSGNRPETMLLQFAAHLLGCRTVWIAGYTPVREQADFLRRARVDHLVYDTSRYLDLAAELLQDWQGTVLCLGPGGQGPDLLAPLPAGSPTLPEPAPGTAPESLFCTSGTTGRPKLVHHEQRFFSSLLLIAEAWMASGAPTLKHLALTGFTHVSGQMTNLLMLFTGSTIVLGEGSDIPALLDLIAAERVSSTLFTPVLLYQVLDHPALDSADLSSLLLLNIGGGPVFPSRLRQAAERLGPVVRLVYGLSEAAFVTEYRGVTVEPEHPQRLRSCGTVFADAQVDVRDENGKPLPAGEVGEVWVTGSLVMTGYWDEPELTREALADGWLRTGDLGYVEEDGYLYLVDRAKDMIVTGRGAANVFSRPVEDVLVAHPEVSAAAVIGVPDESLGEAVHAYVVAVPGATVTGEELRGLVAAELREYCAPSVVEFVDSLPYSETGKVDKKALRARHPDLT